MPGAMKKPMKKSRKSKPVLLAPKKSAKEMSATYRKKAQAKRSKPTHGNANTPGFAFGKKTI